MKKLLLLPMLMCLLLAGCRPDEDVDMPEPQKPVSELILGDWNGSFNSSSYINIYQFDNGNFYITDPDDPLEYIYGEYVLSENEGKNYIYLIDDLEIAYKYEITAISDSIMTWKSANRQYASTGRFTRN